jgi:prevent-host-death family protein
VHEHVFVHDTNYKGNVAEAAIAATAVKLGIEVLRPQFEHGRYDLVFELGSRFLRIQCKWARLVHGKSVIYVQLSGSRHTPGGYVRTTYSADEIDAVAVYCEELDQCYLLPIDLVAGKHGLHLRLTAPRNAQRAALNWAADYRLGAVAQLGERRLGRAEATGSSPVSSTQALDSSWVVGAHEFRNHFGYYMERAAAGQEILITRRGSPHARLGPPAASQRKLDLAPLTTRPRLFPRRSPSSDAPRSG